jgi:hypothetical protein
MRRETAEWIPFSLASAQSKGRHISCRPWNIPVHFLLLFQPTLILLVEQIFF